MRLTRRPFLAITGAALLAACQQQGQPATGTQSPEASVVLRATFAFNSYRLPPGAGPELDALAQAMSSGPQLQLAQFDINGHTDIVGRLGYNMGLSMLRAGTVMDVLVSRGVIASRMRAQGFGPLHLLDPANPRSGVNRRVEVVARYA
jgi:outer membrane protein OmpA-like peptidoglycan-associated protein